MYDIVPKDLKDAREKRQLKADYVGDQIGLTKQHVYAIERGERRPSLPVIFKMCELYGIELRITAENAKAWN